MQLPSKTTLEVNGQLSMVDKKSYCELVDCDAGAGPFISNVIKEDCENVTTPAGDYEVCASDIKITGNGIITGDESDPWSWWIGKVTGFWRPHLITFNKVNNVEITGVTLKDPPNHFIEIVECVNSRVHKMIFSAPYLSPNSDGLNFYGGE